MITVNWRTDFSMFASVQKSVENKVENGLQATAEAIVDDIRSSWSTTVPSSWGNPPAVDTGVLDSSVKAENVGRDTRGRFAAGENAMAWSVTVKTSENDPHGEEYAQALEDPNYLNRQFLEPAVERAAGLLGYRIKNA